MSTDPEHIPDSVKEEILDQLKSVGEDRTPTKEMLAKGSFGNGSWNLTDESVEKAYEEAHAKKLEEQDSRRAHFNEEAKEALSDAVSLHQSIISIGLDITQKLAKGEKVTAAEHGMIAKAQKSAIELTDRAAGKSKSTTEHTENKTLLSMLISKNVDE